MERPASAVITCISGDAVRRIREAFNEATGTPLEENASQKDLAFRRIVSVTASPAPAPLRYGICRKACPASVAISPSGPINARFTMTSPTRVLCRLSCPRFVAELHSPAFETRTRISRVHWIDDPGDRRAAIIEAACTVFILSPPTQAA